MNLLKFCIWAFQQELIEDISSLLLLMKKYFRVAIALLLVFFNAETYAADWPPTASNYNNFPTVENPLSQGFWWIEGLTTGLDWLNVKVTAGGRAQWTAISTGFNDCIATLIGTWGPNQQAQATIGAIAGYHNENELRLNTTISAHVSNGYEFNCSNAYQQIVRWNGSLGNFDLLVDDHSHSCVNGDIFKVTSVQQANGSMQLTAFKNGVQINTVNDSTAGRFTGGSPGIGMFVTTGFNIDDSWLTNVTFTDNMPNSTWASSQLLTNAGRAVDWTQAGLPGGIANTTSGWASC